LARMEGDGSLEADAGDYLALINLYHGDVDAAQRLLNEALVTHRQHAARLGEADDLDGLGLVAAAAGDGEKAERLLDDSLHMYESLKDDKGAAWVRSDLAQVALILHKPQLSRVRAHEALAAGRKLKDWGLIGWAQRSLGIAATMCGQHDEAREALQESLSLFVLLGNQRATVLVLEAVARFAAATSRHDEASQLAAATEAQRQRIRVPRNPADEALLGSWLASSMAVLSPVQRDRAAAMGRTMTLEQAVALARDL
jgi:tetratricopeptide (TPR) repeat protein